MKKYSDIPELLEQFMAEQDTEECWVTVQELRDRFGLTRYQGNTVSGFLRRLEFGTYGQFPYIVIRIEHGSSTHSSNPPKCRYLIQRKGIAGTTMPREPEKSIQGNFFGIPNRFNNETVCEQ